MRYSLAAALLVLALIVWFVTSRPGGQSPLVVYCAHDAVFSESVLRQFEKKTGIRVAARFDTEATKSLGFIELLTREEKSPRCDVFWNNELLGMIDLEKKGILVPYQGAGHARIPAAFKAGAGHWTGFAARLRVYIVHRERARIEDIPRILAGDLSRVAIANPLYGTTLTQYTALWHRWGGEKLTAWHRDCRARGIREVRGNAAVKDAVAHGTFHLGFTDSDDYFDARDAGAPVEMSPVRLETGETICIPNTVAIIRGTRREADARKLVDYLLSAETEIDLSRSKSRQIPLGPVPVAALSDEVRQLAQWASQSIPLTSLGDARAECLAWLKSQSAQ